MSKLSRTSHSFYQGYSSPRKVNFQTKLKIRGTNEYAHKQDPAHHTAQREQQNIDLSQSYNNDQALSCLNSQKDELDKSFHHLTNLNFSHHNSQQCLCSECSCGRHLCKLHVVKPDLRKSTTYRKSFQRSKSIKNSPVVIKQEVKSLPKVEMNSTYAFSFKNKEPNKVVKQHPQDELKFEGPVQKLTMYRVNYPGNRGKNPYYEIIKVRPKQFSVRGQFPFKNKKSAYKQSYNKFDNVRLTESGKMNDQLKTGYEALFRESFYQEKFKQPNSEDYTSITKYVEKRQINPRYAHQYETNYDKQFVPTEPTICQAKIKLETRYKDSLSQNKDVLSENADFKALSSTFHALSMAPYGQYQ